jgi:hypothetical protein
MPEDRFQYVKGRDIGSAICAAIPDLTDDMRRGIADSVHHPSRDTLITSLMTENQQLRSIVEELCHSLNLTRLDAAERVTRIGTDSLNAKATAAPG